MARKKAAEVIIESPVEVGPVVEAPAAKEVVTVYAVVGDLHHPFQRRWIYADGVGVEVVRDSWIDCQVEAGLLKVV